MGLFKAEYAKSSRSGCKGCKDKIERGSLRLAVMVQSRVFDGKVPKWFHYDCFWQKERKVLATFEIQGFEGLRWEDQKKIKETMKDNDKKPAGDASSAADADADDESAVDTFTVGPAKSWKSICHGCLSKIPKKELRISKKDTTSRKAKWYGPQDNWYHAECFLDTYQELGFDQSKGLESLSGYSELSPDEQKLLTEKFKDASARGTKRRSSTDEGPKKRKKRKLSEDPEDKALREQSQLLWKVRDNLEKDVKVQTMKSVLDSNDQFIPSGYTNILDTLTDCMVFGALVKCPDCSKGKLKIGMYGYNCSGNLSEWTKCLYKTHCPKRKPLEIEDESKEEADILKNYKYVARDRYFQEREGKRKLKKSATSTATDSTDSGPPPLEGMKFVMIGKFKQPKSEMARQITDLGGTITTYIDDTVAACITTEEEVTKKIKPLMKAKAADVHVIDEGFLDDVQKGGAALMIAQHSLGDWGSDPVTRMDKAAKAPPKLTKKFRRFDKKFANKDEGTTKMTAKGGAIIDPDTGIADSAHVIKHKGALLNVVLGQVDIVTDINAYYKLQALQADDKTKWWLWRSWGRVGTSVGSKKLTECTSLKKACKMFEDVYHDKTHNQWKDRDSFEKKPNKFYPLDIEYAEEDEIKGIDAEKSKTSSLPKSVQDLVCTIFDIEKMKNVMTEFEIDLKKMPLGKLSKKQLKSAYSVLTELQKLVDEGGSHTKILDASNRFYTLIPHDFGMRRPHMLDTKEMIRDKTEMIDNLLEIEVAYSLLKGGKDSDDPVNDHYEKLKCQIERAIRKFVCTGTWMDPDGERYKKLLEYVENTHGYSHSSYKLEVEQIFKVRREGEAEMYKKFCKLHNRKLLWHGSRVTNFAGILSQGLRIAPPEAPMTGYMFGKGVYFADMVSKSANYCRTSRDYPAGILLLCEVALGDMYELTKSEYISDLPDGKQSCKGCGMTIPDPSQTYETKKGVKIPCGKGIKATDVGYSSLNYNEYIVYDVDQINIKYLLKTKFNYH